MSTATNKITELIKNKPFSYSFEVTPDVSLDQINKLDIHPAFYSITWHAGSHKCKDLDIAPLRLAKGLRSKGKNVLLHLSCDLLRKDSYLDGLLEMLQERGICNLFLMLGETYDSSKSDFKNTKELLLYIRQKTGNYFCIGVAGFPDYPDEKLLQLKEKIDGGADFIITQAIFEANVYKNYVQKCEKLGITVPIIPGIFLFETQKELTSFTNMCKVKVSDDILTHAKNKNGVEIIKEMIKDICNIGLNSLDFHFFTLNKLDRVSAFISEINT